MTAPIPNIEFEYALGEKVEASFMGSIVERAQAFDRNGRLINKYQIRIHGENRMVWLDGDYVFAAEDGGK